MNAQRNGKKILRRAGKALGAVAGLAGLWAAYVAVSGIPRYEAKPPTLHVEVTTERVARGKKLASLLCAECHADEKTGRLSGKHLTEIPAQFGEVWSKNITRDPNAGIGSWTDGEIAYALRTGIRRDGQFMPPWMPRAAHLSDEDMASVISYLRSDEAAVAPVAEPPAGASRPSFLSKALTHTVMKPLPYPTAPIVIPPREDRVAFGRYLVASLDCYSCHSADFVKVDPLVPEQSVGFMGGGNAVRGADGAEIFTANLTPDDATGIGRWSEDDFVHAVKKGFRPDGRVLRYPMLPKTELDDDEARAIYAYLRTVPKLSHDVPRKLETPTPPDGNPGKKLYVTYGCVGCHGDTGVGMGGLADLRKANEHYPNDADLQAWIEDAPSKKPGTKMPAWRGIVRDADYALLIGYVRSLAAGGGKVSAL
jgi:mono/diheme cytochrome c family protein